MSEPRAPSSFATLALDNFARLHLFFGRDAPLAAALRWDEATVACWRKRQVVRPQVKKSAQVLRMLQLCDQVRPHMQSDRQVGQWLSAPSPHLRGDSPAQMLAARGQRGLDELASQLPAAIEDGLAAVAEWEAEHGPPSEQDLAAADAVLARARTVARDRNA